MTACEGSIIIKFSCVTFNLRTLSWVTTLSHGCVLIRLHSVCVV